VVQQPPQQVSDDPFAAPSSSSPAPGAGPPAGVMKAALTTPPKKSAADILKMFDSPQGQVSGQQPACCTWLLNHARQTGHPCSNIADLM
jgi:hypothetical protein